MFGYDMRYDGGPDVSDEDIRRQLSYMSAWDLAKIDEDGVVAIVAEMFGYTGEDCWDMAWDHIERMQSDELYALPGVDKLVDDDLIERVLEERYERLHDAEPYDYED